MQTKVDSTLDLRDLSNQNRALTSELKAWREKFPDSDARTSPLLPHWRSAAPGSELGQDLVALNLWVDHLFAYINKLQSLQLIDLVHSWFPQTRTHYLTGEHCLRILDGQYDQLLLLQDTQDTQGGQPKTQGSEAEALCRPLLVKAGWSNLDWAREAKVDHKTVDEYLAGKRDPYPSTRKKLADALGVQVDQLP